MTPAASDLVERLLSEAIELLERSQYWCDDEGLSMWREDVRAFLNKEQEQ